MEGEMNISALGKGFSEPGEVTATENMLVGYKNIVIVLRLHTTSEDVSLKILQVL